MARPKSKNKMVRMELFITPQIFQLVQEMAEKEGLLGASPTIRHILAKYFNCQDS